MDLVQPGTSSEHQSKLGFGDFAESQPNSSVLSPSSGVNPLIFVDKRNISQSEQSTTAGHESRTLSESDLTLGLGCLEALEITSKIKEPTLLNQNESSQQNKPPEKKRRGRLRKEDLVNIKPTRVSQRVRKCPKNFETKHNPRNSWSVKDKENLLRGLEKWGPDNLDALQREIPNKQKNQIVYQIKFWREAAHADVERRLLTEKKKSPNAFVNCIRRLDEWIAHFSEEEAPSSDLIALSNVFLLISEYGDFPPPTECDGVDFRAMYRYIHCMLNGTPYFGVNQATAKVLLESIDKLLTYLNDSQQVSKLRPHLLRSVQKLKPRIRTYGRRPNVGTAWLKNPKAMFNSPGINPLNIPPNILAKSKQEVGGDPEDDD